MEEHERAYISISDEIGISCCVVFAKNNPTRLPQISTPVTIRSHAHCRERRSPRKELVGDLSIDGVYYSIVMGDAVVFMKRIAGLCGLGLLVVLTAPRGRAEEGSYYRLFLGAIDTNSTRIVALESPLLIDTNNNTCKLTNFVVNLAGANATGGLGEVYLGMTMEQVVAVWGKPSGLYSRCYGGPRFCYNGGLSVIFDQTSNSVIRVIWIRHEPPQFPRFALGLAAGTSSTEEYIRVLGMPSGRKDELDIGRCELDYDTLAANLHLILNEGTLFSFSLNRPR
jgi:hypothetical protein